MTNITQESSGHRWVKPKGTIDIEEVPAMTPDLFSPP